MDVIKITDKPFVESAVKSDSLLVISGGKLYQAKISSLSEALTEGEIDAILKVKEESEAFARKAKVDAENALSEAVAYVDGLDPAIIESRLTGKADNLYFDENEKLLYLTCEGEIISDGIAVSTGGGGGGGGSSNNAVMNVTNTTGWMTRAISEDYECKLSVTWSSVENDNETGNGTLTVTVNGVRKQISEVTQGELTIDVTRYLSTGVNKVKVNISDAYGNSRTVAFTISLIALFITSQFDATMAYTAGEDILFTYTPVGVVSKNVKFIVDGEEVASSTVASSGRQVSQLIPGLTHGSHALVVFFTAEVEGAEVKSNELLYELVVVGEDEAPIIASTFRQEEVVQYNTLSIPYTVYTPNRLTSAVDLYANDEKVATLTVDRTEQVWAYRTSEVGEITLKIVTDETEKVFTLNVTESDIDVEAETDSLALHLSSYGRSNAEEKPGVWQYNDIRAVLSNFNYVSDGWVKDDNGVTVLRVAGDAKVDIPYQPFSKDFRATGKTIEIEFATNSVLNYDAVIMSCMSGGRGIEMTAQKASLASEQSSIFTQYKENEHVRISFVVEKRSENRLLIIYINGIMSGAVQYPEDDDFSQTTPVNISIGSKDCTMDIYNIRVYDNNLTRHQVLNNWIADTSDGGLMAERYHHNAVYDEYGSIVIDKLPSDLPYMVVNAPELSQYKGDKKTISGRYVDPQDESRSFTFEGAQMNVQGTSSQYYARKNYKIGFKGGVTKSNGEKVDKLALRPGAVPTDAFTFKADVASSEGANNVELVRLYEDATPYKTIAQQNNSAVRQGIRRYPV